MLGLRDPGVRSNLFSPKISLVLLAGKVRETNVEILLSRLFLTPGYVWSIRYGGYVPTSS